MVTLDCTSILTADITQTTYASSNSYYIGGSYTQKKPVESKIQRRNRISLKKSRASWVQLDEKKPNVKTFVKHVIPMTRRHRL